jgi:hypothetical protein
MHFLPAVAIPLAVAIGAGDAPAQSPKVAGLLAASKEEVGTKVPWTPSAPRTRRERLTK